MPGSLFPRSPSPNETTPMKHVHFTPPARRTSKSTNAAGKKQRPENVPLPRSRSNSPIPNEKLKKPERGATRSEDNMHAICMPSETPDLLQNRPSSRVRRAFPPQPSINAPEQSDELHVSL